MPVNYADSPSPLSSGFIHGSFITHRKNGDVIAICTISRKG
jgi:hypothetical protein